MRFFFLTHVLLHLALVLGADSAVLFVSPGSSASNTASSSNAIHPIGSVFHIAWSGTNPTDVVSIVLFQLDGNDLVYPFEYVEQSVINETSLDWTVNTTKNFTISHEFLFNIFFEGATTPAGVSQTFNITIASTDSITTSSTTTSTSTTSTRSTSYASTSSLASSTSSTPSATNRGSMSGTTAISSAHDGGLSTGAKVGIGLGVPVVALLGLSAGYFLFRHQARKHPGAIEPFTHQQQVPMDSKPAASFAIQTNEMNQWAHTNQTNEMDASPGVWHSSAPHELYGDSARY